MVITRFPPAESANEFGLVAVGGDLEISSLLLAYSKGIFPWPISEFHQLAWFSPDPRGILKYENLHISRSLKKALKLTPFKITFNQDFVSVILECSKAKNRKDGPDTWITEKIIDAYIDLHHAGHAYSVETWLDDELVGGLYGVAIGTAVSGESMFYKKPNASKAALIALMEHLHHQGIDFLDTQVTSPIVQAMGGSEITRAEFLQYLPEAMAQKVTGGLFSR